MKTRKEQKIELYKKITADFKNSNEKTSEELIEKLSKLEKDYPNFFGASRVRFRTFLTRFQEDMEEFFDIDYQEIRKGREVFRPFTLIKKRYPNEQDIESVLKGIRVAEIKRPFISTTERVMNVIKAATLRKDATLKLQEVKEIAGLKNITSQIIYSWGDIYNHFGINLKPNLILDTIPGVKNSKKLTITNAGLLLESFLLKYEEWYGKRMMIQPTQKPSEKKEVVVEYIGVSGTKLEGRLSPITNKEGIIYLVGGICKDKPHSIELIIHNIQRQMGTVLSKNDLLDLLPEDEFVEKNGKIGLKDDISWDLIKDKFGPGKQNYTVLARIGMDLNSVTLISGLEKVEVLSEINENDNVFKITLSDSRIDYKKLMRLFRTFRGTDKILDNDVLVGKLNRDIRIQDGISNKFDITYQLQIGGQVLIDNPKPFYWD